ncbi:MULTISPECIES: hypothetical protein [Streptomyces]|uniref:hypothetical protein n=1 Tax=Streptomyces TaxID=1883 RepID=UPI001D1307BA|nr:MULTISPECIES: hypothetical protein [Streptomyces]
MIYTLCVVRDDGEWFTGQLDDDGSTICWAAYGSDLDEAIRSPGRHSASSGTFATGPGAGGMAAARVSRATRSIRGSGESRAQTWSLLTSPPVMGTAGQRHVVRCGVHPGQGQPARSPTGSTRAVHVETTVLIAAPGTRI